MTRNSLRIALIFSTIITTNIMAKEAYTMEYIYNTMCIECHSTDGSGNTEKLTPSMRDETLQDIISALKEVENDDGHVIMNHNREKIIERGMEYSAEKMSVYMFERFKE